MPAVSSSYSGVSEPFLPLAAISIPRSGSINDVKVAYDRAVLGALTVTDLGVGAWDFAFAGGVPLSGSLIITTGIEGPQTVGTRLQLITAEVIGTASIRVLLNEILITAANNVSAAGVDLNAWVKVERSVF